jgi:hypothetical protein
MLKKHTQRYNLDTKTNRYYLENVLENKKVGQTEAGLVAGLREVPDDVQQKLIL